MTEVPSPQSSNSAGDDEHLSAVEAARISDAAAAGRVLVFGSLPPDARDLDLLAREEEERSLAAELDAQGFERLGVKWARFHDCGAVGIDVVPAADWGLPQDELEALFAEATPLEGYESLAAPAPHHALLIAARRVARSGGYGRRLRARVAAIAEGTAGVWDEAERRAPVWDARGALARLRELHEAGASPGLAARLRALGVRVGSTPASNRRRGADRTVRRLTRRPAIVALSGLDGAGKSFQATRLAGELVQLGIDTAVVWPSATNVMYQANPRLKRALHRMLAAMGHSSETTPQTPSEQPGDDPAERPIPRQAAPVAHVLALIVAVVQAWSFRRGARRTARGADVVIYDRYTLDSIVYMRHRWGQGRPLRIQSALLRRLSRTPDVAFLLEVPPEVAYERKRDFPLDNLRERAQLYRDLHERLGVTRLDGELPRDALCARIARVVWRRVA